jgi:hypothetical protein
VRNLNAGLDAIEWTGKARATFTRRLIATHTLAIRMTRPVQSGKATVSRQDDAGNHSAKAPEQRLVGMLAGSTDEFDALAQTFTRGMWFDFKVDETTRRRCRLSWVSPMRTRLLFTDRDGLEPLVRSENEVAELLRYGRLTAIDQKPIVSRALERILSDADFRLVA